MKIENDIASLFRFSLKKSQTLFILDFMCKDMVPVLKKTGYEHILVDYSDTYEGKAYFECLTLVEIFYFLGSPDDDVKKILITADKFLLSKVPKISWVVYGGVETTLESKYSLGFTHLIL